MPRQDDVAIWREGILKEGDRKSARVGQDDSRAVFHLGNRRYKGSKKGKEREGKRGEL